MTQDKREPLKENTNQEKRGNFVAKLEEGKTTKAILRRVSSVRDAFGTFRQVREEFLVQKGVWFICKAQTVIVELSKPQN